MLAVRDACPGWVDGESMSIAVNEQRWIITFDRDYGDLVFKQSLPAPPAIVLLRESHYRPAEPLIGCYPFSRSRISMLADSLSLLATKCG